MVVQEEKKGGRLSQREGEKRQQLHSSGNSPVAPSVGIRKPFSLWGGGRRRIAHLIMPLFLFSPEKKHGSPGGDTAVRQSLDHPDEQREN